MSKKPEKQPSEKRPRGRPPVENKADQTLGRVRVTQSQIDSYQAAAGLEGRSMSAWVREVLDKAVKRLKG